MAIDPISRAYEPSHQIRGDGTAGQRVDGYHAQAAAVRSVSRNAHDRNARAGRAANAMAASVCGRLGKMMMPSTLSWIAASSASSSPSPRLGHVRNSTSTFSSRMASASSRIPSRTSSQNEVVPCGVLTEIRRVFREDKYRGGEIGAVAQSTRHLQNSGLGLRTDSGIVVQRPVNGADGSAQRLRDVTERGGRLTHFVGLRRGRPIQPARSSGKR